MKKGYYKVIVERYKDRYGCIVNKETAEAFGELDTLGIVLQAIIIEEKYINAS